MGERIYIMTDMEGVAGNLNWRDWCRPGSPYYEMGKEFLTGEINAAVAGLFDAGAEHILVADGHGSGGINPKLLDPRVELMRGWPAGWPLGLDETYDAVAWVGQHAKAGTPHAHLAHTQSFRYLDLSVNGISIGEFGQFALCASEVGVRAIFGAGDLAFTKEAEALVPGIETVAVKRGTTPGTGDECDHATYGRRNEAAIHLHPTEAQKRIRAGAARALRRMRVEEFGIIPMKPPYEQVVRLRATEDGPATIARGKHPSSFAGLMKMPLEAKPVRRKSKRTKRISTRTHKNKRK